MVILGAKSEEERVRLPLESLSALKNGGFRYVQLGDFSISNLIETFEVPIKIWLEILVAAPGHHNECS